ncbi:DHH family phosphoesterase [Candidatus Microgenomates bacterium]|nr:DHH family phosphoesterase [Candidatus Microgenomates bacterium]
MNFQEEIDKIKNSLTSAKEILLVINKSPSLDSVAASLTLYLGLKKLGKKVSIFCQDKIRVEFSNLIAVNKIVDTLGGKNFIISLDYKEGAIDKVSYNIEGEKFNLVIEPRPNAPQLTSESVHYSYSGSAADMVFAIDALTLQDLGKIYEEKKELFTKEKIINIDRQSKNENFGEVNFVVPQAASTSEIIALILKSLAIKLDQDMATNLLAGIISASNNFNSPQTNATTLEMAALCLRAGGKKTSFSPSSIKEPFVFPDKLIKTEEKKEEKKEIIKEVKKDEKKKEKAPPDWLKPKIYKGSTLL